MAGRSGLGAVNQSMNVMSQMTPSNLSCWNTFLDEQTNRAAISNVRQISGMAFYQRDNRWVDSRLVNEGKTVEPAKAVEFGSAEIHRPAERLAAEGRQGGIAPRSDSLLQVNGEPVWIKRPRE